MHLVMQGTKTHPYIVSVLIKRWKNEKHSRCLNGEQKKNVREKWGDQNNKKENSARKRRGIRTACIHCTMRSADKYLCKRSRSKSASILRTACDRCYRDPVSPLYFAAEFSPWNLSVGESQKNEWTRVKEMEKSDTRARSWTVGEKVKEQDKEEGCGQERKWNLKEPLQLAESHREFTWG